MSSEKKYRVMLDIDVRTREEVVEEAERLRKMFSLGDYRIEPSTTESCWHLIFPKSMVSKETAQRVARECKLVDHEWVSFTERYGVQAINTAVSRGFHHLEKPKNEPVREIRSPVKLEVVPATTLGIKRVVKLCENLEDKTWEWRLKYGIAEGPLFRAIIEIGCMNEAQALRRVEFIKKLYIEAGYYIGGKKVE